MEWFGDLVGDGKQEQPIAQVHPVQEPVKSISAEVVISTDVVQEGDDSWVQVLVPVLSLQKHIKSKLNDVNVTEDEAIQEASREKVLEMLGSSRVETIPLSTQTVTVPCDSEPSSGRLFVPPPRKSRAAKNPNPAFRCPECYVGFTRADNLKRHFKILHKGSETFTCPHCNQAFSRKNTLQRHITSQHTREKKYTCHLCNKTFIYSFEVGVHIQNCHTDNKGYPCMLCKITFKWPRSLERHVVSSHEGIKYKCTECTTTLSSLDAYKKHGARFHPTLQHRKKGHRASPDEAVLVCDYCRSVFRSQSSLDRHLDRIHRSVEGDIECEWCSNIFKSHATYERHIAKFHDINSTEDLSKPAPAKNSCNFMGDASDQLMQISLTEFLSNNGVEDEESNFDFPSPIDL